MNAQERYRKTMVGMMICQGCGAERVLTRGHLDAARRRGSRLLYCRACSMRRVAKRKRAAA